ncbi:Methylthioadenosine deaminase [hydrothermal vent metagenome]|uniref:Methylthioadenosine deaminase n=1 Tax=hydrothermal vent metagenome TaxID=652676 RepID=A0A3B1AX52_9ZZZZ
MNIDTLVNARWIIPVVPDNQILEYHSLAIQSGRILELLPTDIAKEKYTPQSEQDLPGHALIPGLINAHTHSPMSLLRGLADDLPLMTWLNDHIWPAEGRWVSEEFVADGTHLAVAEMLRGGITCFNDMYFFPEVTARVSAAAGMRAVIGLIVIDFPSAWAADSDAYLRQGLEVQDQYRNHALISTAFAPHAPYSVSDEPLERIRTLANELEIPIHMHVHETRDEIQQGLQQSGERPLQRLQKLGLVSPSLTAVHMTQLEEDEILAFAKSGASLVHCPQSNLKLASGFCPVHKLMEAGINVAIGTDSAASNNGLDMFSETKTAALLAKGVAQDASVIPAATALRMATLNGAIALGIADDTGSLEPGKSADITAINLDHVDTQPVYNPVSQLIYATGRDKVSDVWVAGRQVVQGGELTTVNHLEIMQRAREWGNKIETG